MLGKTKLLITLFALPFLVPMQAFASNVASYKSNNYQTTEVFFGSGGSLNQSSPNYQSKVAVGELGVGNFISNNYQAYAGFNTTSQPFLEAVVTGASINLGVLSTTSTATATGTFYVRAWDASGYTIQTGSPPPTNQENTSIHLATNSTPTSPYSPGTEQFGMNLVADTTPSSLTTDSPVSANPVQSTTYSYGAAYGNYATVNKYAYNQGDTIAQSPENTSSTIYTLSYIFNISYGTPDGNYVFAQDIVATATY